MGRRQAAIPIAGHLYFQREVISAPSDAGTAPATLTATLTLVEQAERATGAGRAELVRRALATLDGDPTLDGADWLAAPLLREPPDLALAATRLTAAQAVLAAPITATPSDAAAARTVLDQTLADPRFHPQSFWSALLQRLPGWLMPAALLVARAVAFVQRGLGWPMAVLRALLNWLQVNPVGRAGLAAGAVAVAVGVGLLYLHGLRAALVRQAGVPTTDGEPILTAAAAGRAAQAAAAAERYREACHFLLLATLLDLEERGLARFDRSATNQEHLARLSRAAALPNAELASQFARLVAEFDGRWYGQAAVRAEDYRTLAALAAPLRQEATR